MADPEEYDFTDPEQALEYLRKEWVSHVEDENTTAHVGMVSENTDTDEDEESHQTGSGDDGAALYDEDGNFVGQLVASEVATPAEEIEDSLGVVVDSDEDEE